MQPSIDKNLAIFVNTSDGFQDCWEPFFILLRKKAEKISRLPIYLNTERATYNFSELDITSTNVWFEDEIARPTWSTCLIRGLEKVEQSYILYMQEDYFLNKPVDSDWILRAKDILSKNTEVDVVYLNKYGPIFSTALPFTEGFVRIPMDSKYLISTQAAIWRRSALQAYARDWENGWMFEKFGSWRAARSNRLFVSIAQNIMHREEAIDYVYTGVMKGKWNLSCIDLFLENEIYVDFSKRGFYQNAGKIKTKYEVFQKLVNSPLATLKSLRSLWLE